MVVSVNDFAVPAMDARSGIPRPTDCPMRRFHQGWHDPSSPLRPTHWRPRSGIHSRWNRRVDTNETAIYKPCPFDAGLRLPAKATTWFAMIHHTWNPLSVRGCGVETHESKVRGLRVGGYKIP